MGKLAEWCAGQPSWAVDAMQRVALSAAIGEETVEALVNRVALAHRLAVPGDHPCLPFREADLTSSTARPDDVVLRSVGPIQGLDRLAADQVLKFGLDGITIVFGDNGSGKSGYTRALRQLCLARVDTVLHGNVFSDTADPAKTITYSYQKASEPAVTQTWSEGEAKPDALSGITLLDTENLRIYVESKNEILYLPPEVECIARLATLYQAAAGRYRTRIDPLAAQCTPPYGGHYQPTTTAGRLIARLQIGIAEPDLPPEQDVRAAGRWGTEDQTELERLRTELVQGPIAVATRYERIAAACTAAAAALNAVVAPLSAEAIGRDAALIETKRDKKRVAAALAAAQIGGQPIAATGGDPWRALYQLARAFAAQAGVRAADQPFAVGDPCPFCQQPIGDDAARRLAAFDAFVAGRAATDAADAAQAVVTRIAALRDLAFRTTEELKLLLEETAELGIDAAARVGEAIAFNQALEERRDTRMRQLQDEQIADVAALPDPPIAALQALAATLAIDATALRSGDDRTAATEARIAELSDQKQLHDQLDEILARRNDLRRLHRYKACEAALGTGALSRLATTLRKDLVSPALKARIDSELSAFGLTHIPLKFADETSRGSSYFEMHLASEKRAKKSRVLSEGEQRALSLACFLAESHVAGRRSGIILDDPVTSLDHSRVRRVARRLVEETAKGRQIVIFTHNLIFYHELMLACTDRAAPVAALPCLIQQGPNGEFGLVTVNDEPWVARKVKERERTLQAKIAAVPDDLAVSSDEYKRRCTDFYAALRETWERAVEELVLNDVVQRFGSDVGTQRLGGVEVSDADFTVIHHAMKRASEHSGHDQAAGRQIDVPTKDQMQADLHELIAFRTTRTKAIDQLASRRRALVAGPPKAIVAPD